MSQRAKIMFMCCMLQKNLELGMLTFLHLRHPNEFLVVLLFQGDVQKYMQSFSQRCDVPGYRVC